MAPHRVSRSESNATKDRVITLLCPDQLHFSFLPHRASTEHVSITRIEQASNNHSIVEILDERQPVVISARQYKSTAQRQKRTDILCIALLQFEIHYRTTLWLLYVSYGPCATMNPETVKREERIVHRYQGKNELIELSV